MAWRLADAAWFPLGVTFVLVVTSRATVFAEPLPATAGHVAPGPSTADTVTSLAALVTAASVLIKAVTECLRTWRRIQRDKVAGAGTSSDNLEVTTSIVCPPGDGQGKSEGGGSRV